MAKYERFIAKAIKGEFGESNKKGTPFVGVTFEVIDGESKGTKFPWDGYLTDATTERTVQSLRHCGCTFPGDDITNLTGLGTKVVEIQVEDGDYGKKVAWVNEPRDSSVTDENKMDAAGKKALAAKFKGTLIGLRAGTPGVSKTKPATCTDPFAVSASNDTSEPLATTGTGGTDDDIPF